MPSYSPAQDGHGGVGGWSDDDTFLALLSGDFGSEIGLVFEVSGNPIESGQVALTLSDTEPFWPVVAMQLYLVPELAPDDFSGAALPGERGGVLIAEVEAGGDAGTVVAFTFGETFNPANQAQVEASLTQLVAISEHPGWTHRLAFDLSLIEAAELVHFESLETVGGTAPALETVEGAPLEVEPKRGLRLGPAFTGDGGILGPHGPFER